VQDQRDGLLAFAGLLDDSWTPSLNTAVSPYLLRAICVLHRKPDTSNVFWQGWNRLHAVMGQQFYEVWTAVSHAMGSRPRSNSLVEISTRGCATISRCGAISTGVKPGWVCCSFSSTTGDSCAAGATSEAAKVRVK